jgi:hypothetical protein
MDKEERFWNHIDVKSSNDCWNWKMRKDNDGYGRTQLFYPNIYKKTGAHQIAWILSGNKIEDNQMIRHMCNNPSCCNPNHLNVGTAKDNALDCVNSGRTMVGSKNPSSKLTEQDVKEIKQELANGKKLGAMLGRKYGVSKVIISDIKHNKTWRHV